LSRRIFALAHDGRIPFRDTNGHGLAMSLLPAHADMIIAFDPRRRSGVFAIE
jgi:hypothetical protein